MLATLTIGLLSGSALGAGSPNIGLDKVAPAKVLFGNTSSVTLTASNPVGQPYGYNLSFRDVLPAGVSLASATPPPDQIIPGTGGRTTLVWLNLADLSPGSSFSVSYDVQHDPAVLDVPASYTNNAQAAINTDPRTVPAVTPTGTFAAGTFTGNGTDTATTQLQAIKIKKAEPSPEGELLRGVHDHQTTYTLTVTNNAVNPTTAVVVDDYLPANLEFLACGNVDNSSGEEFPGSGPLNGNAPAPPGCVAPGLVETVTLDPDGAGPLTLGVYTHVRWTSAQIPALASMAPNAVIDIPYLAGIPIQENVAAWPGVAPPTTGAQGANLDNNIGPETTDEQLIRNGAQAAGLYNGVAATSDATTLDRTAEDLRLVKSVTPANFVNGDIVRFTLDVAASEYRNMSAMQITDVLPDGLCPLGASNFESTPPAALAECNPVGGQNPSLAYTSVTENANGSWQLVWNNTGGLTSIPASNSFVITFPARVRQNYQESFTNAGAVNSNDDMTNTASMTGTATVPGGQPHPDRPTSEVIPDSGSATISAGGPAIDKKVAENNVTPMSCGAAGLTYVDDIGNAFGPGDRICFKLRMNFVPKLFTGTTTISDFFPPGIVLDPNQPPVYTSNHTFPASGPGSWTFDGSNPAVPTWTSPSIPDTGAVFEVYLAGIALDPNAHASGDVLGNLMKVNYQNSAGISFPLRDKVDVEYVEPQVGLLKGVRQIDAGAVNGPNVDGLLVTGSSNVQYRVDLTNTGGIDAINSQVWDVLPPGITCAMVVGGSITNGGTCNAAQNRIEWSGITIPANTAAGSLTLTYHVAIPDIFAPGTVLPNTAGVRQYQAVTNIAPGSVYTYIPGNNIDPALEAAVIDPTDADIRGRTAPASDPSNVFLRAATIAKTRSTSVDEAGNAAPDQATIGELITYSVTMVVPQGTSVYDGLISDAVPAGQTVVASPAPVFQLNGAALPASFTASAAGTNPVRITFPPVYANPPSSGDDTFTMTFTARVDDAPANVSGGALANTATFDTKDRAGGAQQPQLSAGTTTAIVEPNIAIVKANDDADGIVESEGYVTYALTVTNTAGTNVATAHDVVITDVLPAGATPVDAANVILAANGAVPCPTTPNPVSGVAAGPCPATPLDSGAWTQATNTIVWPSIASIPPGGSVTVRYRVQLTASGLAGAPFTNSASVASSSMPGTVAGERPYSAGASNTLRFASPSITKSQTPATRTIGEKVGYTIGVTIPAGVRIFDGTIVDTLPDGMNFDAYTAVTCAAGCGSPLDAAITPFATPAQNADGSTTVGWYLGDVIAFGTPSPVARTYALTYTANVDDTYEGTGTPAAGSAVKDGDALTNAAQLGWNTADTQASQPASPTLVGLDGTAPVQQTTTGVLEPKLILNKHVSCNGPDSAPLDTETDLCATQPGDGPFTYTVTITNTGTSPAFDAVIDDTPATTLTNVTLGTNAALNTDGWTTADPHMRWVVAGPIAPGASVSVTYTAAWLPSAQLPTAATAVNTASVPEYFGVPAASRTGNDFFGAPIDYRRYTDVVPDTVTLTIAFPHVVIAKTTAAGNEIDDAEILQPFGWKIVVTNDSSAPARSVVVNDALPANWRYTAGSSSVVVTDPVFTGSIEPTGGPAGPLTWTTGRDLAPGATMTITFSSQPQQAAIGAPGPVHTNSAGVVVRDATGATGNATGAFNGPDDTATANLKVPALTLVKVPDCGPGVVDPECPAPILAGVTGVPYAIAVTNSGDAPARDITVVDDLPAGLTYAGGATALLCAPPACTAADLPFPLTATAPFVTLPGFTEDPPALDTPGPGQTRVTYRIANLPVGAIARVRFLTNVVSPLANGTVLTNTATATAAEIPGTATDTGKHVVASKPFWYGVDSPSFKSSVPVPGTPLAVEDTVTYTVHFTNSGNEIATGVVVSDAIPANTTYVSGSAASSPAASVEYLVGGVYQAAEPADPATVQGLRWLVGTVTTTAPSNTGTVTFAVKVNKPLPNGTVIGNRAELTSVEETLLGLPPNPIGLPPTQTPLTHPVTTAPVLALTKSAPATQDLGAQGTRLNYQLVLRNTGTENASNVEVVDGPPVGTRLATIDSGGAAVSCSTDPGPGFTFGPCPSDLGVVTQIKWSAPQLVTESVFPVGPARSPLAVGFGVDVQLPAINGTILPNTATATSTETLATPTVSNTVRTLIESRPVLTLAKTVDPVGITRSGQVLTYTMASTNTGTDVAHNVALTDPIPANTSYVAGSAAAGAEFLVGGAYQPAEPADPAAVQGLRWTKGSLAVAETLSASFKVTVSSSIALGVTSIDNTATVVGQQRSAGPGGAVDPGSLVATDLPALARSVRNPLRIAALRLSKRGPVRINAGKTGIWRIVVTNTGGVPADNLTISDAIPSGFTLAKRPAKATVRRGVVIWAVGSLAPGASTTVTLTLRANPTAKGQRVNRAVARATNVAGAVRAQARVTIRGAAVLGGGRIPIVTG